MGSEQKKRKKVGLALSGGIARGPVHVGVLAVLEREGIPIDYVAGASAGAWVGAGYCAGLEIPKLRHLSTHTSWRDVVTFTLPTEGLISFARLEALIESEIGCVDIRDLNIPFAAVVTDLDIGEQKILREGRLSTAVRASCSVPGFVTPVKMDDGHHYCDGGVADNLPVDAVRSMGADYIIGVDLFVPTYNRWWGPLGAGAAAIQTLVRLSGGGYKEADCLIVPDLSGASYIRFSRSEEYIRIGEKAAEQAIPMIKAALNLP
jgi:NTE family protein